MVSFYSATQLPTNIGITPELNNGGSSIAKMYKTLAKSSNPASFNAENYHTTDFAKAIYGDGPYNLLRPNHTSETNAVNIDFVA